MKVESFASGLDFFYVFLLVVLGVNFWNGYLIKEEGEKTMTFDEELVKLLNLKKALEPKEGDPYSPPSIQKLNSYITVLEQIVELQDKHLSRREHGH